MLLKRIITAAILIPLILAAIIYLPPLYFSLLVAVFILLGAWEWSVLIGLTKNSARIIYVLCIAFVILTLLFFHTHTHIPTLLTATLIWLWAFIAIINYQKNGSGVGFQFPLLRAMIGVIILISTWISIVILKTYPNFGASWLILVFIIIWSADIGAFFAGRAFGKHALCSRVSPKKTWEGFVGGTVLSVIMAAIGGLFLSLTTQHYIYLLVLALLTALFSVVGDLSVSLLKRMSGVKDSGKIFPGHGGLLDRLDSIAAGMVVFVLGMFVLGL